MNFAIDDLRVGIVFSGGFAKGAYEVGFCKALMEHIDINNVRAVSGASIGALNAYAFINNKYDYLVDVWRNLKFKSAREFFIKSNKRSIIYEYINEMQKDIINNVNVPCYIDYIKVPNITLCYKNINQENIEAMHQYLKASVTVPGLYNPVLINNDYFVDGAFLDNTPITPLEKENLDVIFVLRFDHAGEQYEQVNTNAAIIEIVFDDEKKLKDYFYFNSDLTNKLIDLGYAKSKDILDLVFKYGRDIEYIKKIAKINNQQSCNHIIPKSGEEIVNKINKLRKIFKNEYIGFNVGNTGVYDDVDTMTKHST